MAPRRTRRPTRGRPQTDHPTEGLPVVAIVGRPNVGKSTLFNRIIGERVAIVEDRARTTRDRLYDIAEWNGRRFILVDTGGLESHPGDAIEERVQDQARLAIDEADLIIFMVDAAAGMTPADLEANELLRRSETPVLLAVNKADNPRRELEAAEFHQLGWDETHPISANHGRGVADLLDIVVWSLPPESEAEVARKLREADEEQAVEAEWAPLSASEPADGDGAGDWAEEPDADEAEAAAWVLDDRPARIAIVGRPNVGKSSLLNSLLRQERAIVSDIPGTTRDAIDMPLDWAGRALRLVDTAGIRRRGRVASGPAAERFATLRAMKAVSRADVCVLVLDAADGLTAQDAHVAGYVVDEGVGLVVAINKWDIVEKTGTTFDEYVGRIRREAPFLEFAPVLSISARTGQRVERVLEAAVEIAAERRRRVPTGALNALLREATFRQQPPAVRNRRPRFFYATQASIEPPTFVLFANEAANVHFSYKRYLENRIREAFGFTGTPIRLVIRERSRESFERRPPRRAPRGGKSGGKSSAKAGAKSGGFPGAAKSGGAKSTGGNPARPRPSGGTRPTSGSGSKPAAAPRPHGRSRRRTG